MELIYMLFIGYLLYKSNKEISKEQLPIGSNPDLRSESNPFTKRRDKMLRRFGPVAGHYGGESYESKNNK